MIKPPQAAELRRHDWPAVFGKPWFWQRSSCTMESTRGLAQVIMEMRDEIKKLEAENQQLRDGGGQQGEEDGDVPSVENPYINLRRNVSAPVLERKYKEHAVMTVRRYSIGSNLSEMMREGDAERPRRSDSGWGRLQEEMHHGKGIFSAASRGQHGKTASRHLLQEYVHKNRAKVKTVSFLLPVDDIYTNRPALPRVREGQRVGHWGGVTNTHP